MKLVDKTSIADFHDVDTQFIAALSEQTIKITEAFTQPHQKSLQSKLVTLNQWLVNRAQHRPTEISQVLHWPETLQNRNFLVVEDVLFVELGELSSD